MTMFYGGVISGTWSGYIETTAINNYNATTTVAINYGVYFNKAHEHETKYDSFAGGVSTNGSTSNNLTIPIGKYDKAKGYKLKFGSATFTFTQQHSAFTGYIQLGIKHSGSGAKWKGTSYPKATFTVGAKKSYAVTFNGNKPSDANVTSLLLSGTADPTKIPANQTKWYNETLKISGDVPEINDNGYAFLFWSVDPADYDGKTPQPTRYNPNQSYSDNASLSLYAIWDKLYPPTLGVDSFSLNGTLSGTNAIKNFTSLTVTCSDLSSYYDGENYKELASMSIVIKVDDNTEITVATLDEFEEKPDSPDADGNHHYESVTLTSNPQAFDYSGTFPVYVVLIDTEGIITETLLGDVTFVDPTWECEVVINALPPAVVASNGVLDTVEIYNYTNEAYETVTGNFPVRIISDDPEEPSWAFTYTFDEDHVSNRLSSSASVKAQVSYKHYDSEEKEYRKAFFSTTRNQNYSNGIYNVMFVGGVEYVEEYTSRIWWCYVNNPLYFPDTNYLEVGSNDTMVMGLTKVGDYLAAIKQSKTTDTAIYLVYPTSFDEDTTYAVKQGVQGVGAIARYSFNILGDETLFLSPNGVMAIVPSEDEEHKVQNRSYFIDGWLLKEPDVSNAYSFVFDGKYFLSTGNGSVYVLDGNQRNSWGNDKTNLVYECYYLDNIPANCFVKFGDRLVFSTDDDVCWLGEGYSDAYDTESGEENPPVKAEWSTVFDDDGALHYYKTMQKKGNLVSILPEETDEERTHTKVYVRKDDKKPVEIERSFGVNSTIPSEMFLKKKFKKYKRLQFIIKNEEAEPFGVDSIIKNYTIGNYAKK